MLISQYGLGHKEAGAYLGNSEAVNYNHYTPVSLATIGAKLKGLEDRKMTVSLLHEANWYSSGTQMICSKEDLTLSD